MNQCFWDGFQKNLYPFCEERLCSFVTEPANFWTNIGYLIVAILMIRHRNQSNRRVKNLFFYSTFTLFIGSSLFHMTSTYWAKLLDVSAMFFLSMTILTLALERYSGISEKKANWFFISGLSLSIVFLVVMSFGNVLFGTQILVATVLEWRLKKSGHGLDLKEVGLSILTLLAAFTFWIMDVKKILCYPGNHILTGHGMWHLLAALAIWIYYKSYTGKSLTRVS